MFSWVQKQPPEVFCKNGVLRNFSKFTGKHPCQSLFLNKVARLRPAHLSKKRLWHRCFPVNVDKFLTTPFLTEHLQWLLLCFNDTHRENVCFNQFSKRMAAWLLLTFLIFFTQPIKVGLSPHKKNCIICFIESTLKMMKNAFYFILKVLFVLKIFQFLS